MVGESCGHRGCELNPMIATFTDPEPLAQTMVCITEVVETANQVHTYVQGGDLSCWTASAAGQDSQPLAEGGVEALNVGGIDRAAALRTLQQVLDQLLAALDNASLNRQGTGRALLDDLDNGDAGPSHQAGTSSLAVPGQRRPEDLLEGTDIAGKPIDCQQEGPAQSHLAYLGRQLLNQGCIPVLADRAG